MDHAKWRGAVKGLLFGVMFFLAHIAGWFYSLDQWYLPAGVQVAGFLLLPSRFWPYLFAADLAALLMLRVPRIPANDATWAYFSSVLIPLVYVVGAWGVRRKARALSEQAKWMPLIAAFMAALGAGSMLAINILLEGPADGTTPEFFYVRCVGHFLAILSVTLPVMLWLRRNESAPKPSHFWRDTMISGAAIVMIYAFITVPDDVSDYKRTGLMLTILVPIIWMTLRHGWRGAAIGIPASCFAVVRTLAHFNMEGAYDEPVFIVQHTLVIASAGLLVLGNTISTQYANARLLGMSEKEALHASRAGFAATELMLRRKAISVQEGHQRSDALRKRVVEMQKSVGDYEGALLLNSESVENNARLSALIIDIYPLKIEQDGLNAVLNSQEFADAYGEGAYVLPLLGSNPTMLSMDLQLAAFRCVCNEIGVLSQFAPRAYVIRTRVLLARRRKGILLIVEVRDPKSAQATTRSEEAAFELAARVKAHGGIFKRRHAHQISLWLPEVR